MKNNRYFEEFARVCEEWTREHEEHKAAKQNIIDAFGWDSNELKECYAEEEQMTFPFSQGACKAYRAWRYSEGDEVIMEEFTFDSERHDFIETLRKADIETFVVTNQSTGLMADLHGYAAEGCEMIGLCTVSKKTHRFGEDKEERIMGIRFKVC